MLKKSLLLITFLSIAFAGFYIYADMDTETTTTNNNSTQSQELIPVPKCILMPNEMGQANQPMSNFEERLHTIANKAQENLANAKLSLQRFLKNPELIGWYPRALINQASLYNLEPYNSNNPTIEYTEEYIEKNINTPQQLYRYLLTLINVFTKHPKSTELKMRLSDLRIELNKALENYIPME